MPNLDDYVWPEPCSKEIRTLVGRLLEFDAPNRASINDTIEVLERAIDEVRLQHPSEEISSAPMEGTWLDGVEECSSFEAAVGLLAGYRAPPDGPGDKICTEAIKTVIRQSALTTASSDNERAVFLYTTSPPLIKIINAALSENNKNSVNLAFVSPMIKRLYRAIQTVGTTYNGRGSRVVPVVTPAVRAAFDSYSISYAEGTSIEFTEFVSFSKRVENLRLAPLIFFHCDNLDAFDISGARSEGEVVVLPPSYFTVCKPPYKVQQAVHVQLTFHAERTHTATYLSLQHDRSLRRSPLTPVTRATPLIVPQAMSANTEASPGIVNAIELLKQLGCVIDFEPEDDGMNTLLRECGALDYSQVNRRIFLSPTLDATNPCYRFISSFAGSLHNKIQRIVMVATHSSMANTFVTIHQSEMNSYEGRAQNRMDAASVAGLNRLKQSFVPVVTAPGEPLPSARVLFAWHATAHDKIAAACRDGPRSLQTTDSGYFGTGSYFAFEAEYATSFFCPEPSSGESALILFAVSISHARVLTPERDYRKEEDHNTPHLHGFSKYYSRDPDIAIALASGCDAHFIPVKYYGCVHPLTGYFTPRSVDYQAVDESSAEAEAHELVIGNHHRCIPIAIVYFRN